MTRKNKSTESLKPSNRISKKSTLGEDIIEGLKEVLAHNRGEIKLRTRQFYILAEVDLKAVREKSGLSQTEFAVLYGFNPRTGSTRARCSNGSKADQSRTTPYALT